MRTLIAIMTPQCEAWGVLSDVYVEETTKITNADKAVYNDLSRTKAFLMRIFIWVGLEDFDKWEGIFQKIPNCD